MSSISIVGLGTMAGALAERALAGGHAVELVGRDAARTAARAATLGATAAAPGAAPAGDLVVLAVPYAAAAPVVSGFGDALRGKVLVDLTNPVAADLQSFVTREGRSGAQEIAQAAAPGTPVVKAFNTLFSHVLSAGPARGLVVDVFLAGDDAAAKERVSAFASSLGLRPLDTGPLAMAGTLENLALLQLGLVAHALQHTDFLVGVTLLR